MDQGIKVEKTMMEVLEFLMESTEDNEAVGPHLATFLRDAIGQAEVRQWLMDVWLHRHDGLMNNELGPINAYRVDVVAVPPPANGKTPTEAEKQYAIDNKLNFQCFLRLDEDDQIVQYLNAQITH